MMVKDELKRLVGAKYLSDNPKVLKPYSKDFSLRPPEMPNYVAYPENAEEIQGIIKVANKYKTPVIPCSSGVHFRGSAVPTQGGIILDLRRMNHILDVSEENRMARIEPGVTWSQLKAALEPQGLMTMMPLLPHPESSVITSFLEREPLVNCAYEFGEPLQTFEAVIPNGEIHRSGSASVKGIPTDAVAIGINPEGPGLDWHRLLEGAQGTLGVVTWGIIKIEYLPSANKTFFMRFNKLEDAIDPMYRIGRRMIGYECLLLNNHNLATILAEKWPEDFKMLKEVFSPWTLILISSALHRRPEEKIAYEEEAIREIGKEFIFEVKTALPGAEGVERRLVDMLRRPWSDGGTYWKHRHKGCSQDLFFLTTLNRVPGFLEAVSEVAAKHGYPLNEIGGYIQPIERGRACHCEFDFYYSPNDSREAERIRQLYVEAVEVLLNEGAYFNRPYYPVADIVYDRAASYTSALKKVKNLFDPEGIMCPGNLCF